MKPLIILLLMLITIDYSIAAESSNNDNIYREGAKLYVWVASLNLRQQPSADATVIKKLRYGTPITVLKQTEPAISYQLPFFSYKNTSDAVPQNSEQRQIILDGAWIKVKTEQQEEGYVVNKLLLDIEPMKLSRSADKQYALEEESTDYLIRVFHLNKHQKKVKHGIDKQCDGAKYTTTYNTYTSDTNKVVLEVKDIDDNNQCNTGNGASISIPEFSFDQALVFFNSFLPPHEMGFDYQPQQKFSYALDEAAAGNAELKKTKQGIYFEWFRGMN